MITDTTKMIKHALKGKVRFTKGMVVTYLMTGLLISSTGSPVLAADNPTPPEDKDTSSIVIKPTDSATDTTKLSASSQNSIAIGTDISADGNNDIIIGNQSKIESVELKDKDGRKYALLSGKAPAYADEAGYAYVESSDGSKIYVDRKGVPLADQTDTSKYYQIPQKSFKSPTQRTIAIGDQVTANNQQATAIGNNSTAFEEQALALGSYVKSNNYNATAIGNNAIADGYGAIVIGGDDAGMKNQLYNTKKEGNTEYAQLVYNPELKEVINNPYRVASQVKDLKTGKMIKKYHLQRWNAATSSFEDIPEGDPSMPATYKWTTKKDDLSWDALGIADYYKQQGLTGDALTKAVNDYYSEFHTAESTGATSIAVGVKTQAKADGAVAVGTAAVATGDESMAFGVGTVTTGERSVGFGSLASASGNHAIAIGTYENDLQGDETRYKAPRATADDAVAIGTDTYSDYEKSVALGADSIVSPIAGKNRADYDPNNKTTPITYGETTTAGATNTVNSATVGDLTYGNFAGAQGHGVVSIGAADKEKRLQNVAAGEISATSTDAINGSQLYAATKSIDEAMPVEYRQKTSTGTTLPVIQGIDGRFYPSGTAYDPVTNQYINDAGNVVTPLTLDDMVISFKNGTSSSISKILDNLPATYDKKIADKENTPTVSQKTPNGVEISNIGSNAANVNDILNSGWNLENNGEAKDFVKAYDVVNFVDGRGTKARVNVREDGLISDITFDVDRGEIKSVTDGSSKNTGKVQGATPEEKQQAAEKIASLEKPIEEATTSLNTAKENHNNALADLLQKNTALSTAETELAQAQKDTATAQANIDAQNSKLKDLKKKIADNQAILDASTTPAERDKASALIQQAKADQKQVQEELAAANNTLGDLKNTLTEKTQAVKTAEAERDAAKTTVDTTEATVTTSRDALDTLYNEKNAAESINNKVATVENVVDAINNSGWNVTTSSSDGTVSGTATELINPGETVTLDAGKNIAITQNENKISIATKDEVEFSKVTATDAQGNITNMTGNGITISNNNSNPVSLTNNGLNNGGNRITNVAPGVAPTDAVNVSQLQNEVGRLSQDIDHVGAKAAALTSLKTIQYDPLEPTQISAGVGQYGSATAMAIGISHYKNESTLFSAGIAFGDGAGGKVMANASVTWKFGHRAHEPAVRDIYRNGPISSTYALQDQVSALLNENAAQKAALESQQKKIDELEAKLAKVLNQLSK